MNELQVIVQQTPGEVKWNFQDLKTALKNELEVFKTTQYDDDSIKEAKKDLAELRKLKSKVDEKRKEIKNKCLEVYEPVEQQAKELQELIDEPIKEINARVQEYEEKRKAKCRKKIHEYMDEKFANIPGDIAEKAKKHLYDARWENASAKEKDWKAVIDARADVIACDLDIIKETIEEEFVTDAIEAYRVKHCLADAINRVHELKQQRERFLKQQQEKEAARIAQEEREKENQRRTAEKASESAAESVPRSDIGRVVESIDRQNFSRTIMQSEPIFNQSKEAEPGIVLRIIGNESQYQKIKGYINFVGARFEEV